jgi:hypothetical protein
MTIKSAKSDRNERLNIPTPHFYFINVIAVRPITKASGLGQSFDAQHQVGGCDLSKNHPRVGVQPIILEIRLFA